MMRLVEDQSWSTDCILEWLSYAHCHGILASSYMANMISVQGVMGILFLQPLGMSAQQAQNKLGKAPLLTALASCGNGPSSTTVTFCSLRRFSKVIFWRRSAQ